LDRKYKPYAKALTAHNGETALDGSAQSGLYLKGRDRSAANLLKQQARKKRALEDEEDEEVELTPRKKVSGGSWLGLAHTDPFQAKHGIIGKGKTIGDVAAEKAAKKAADDATAAADAAKALAEQQAVAGRPKRTPRGRKKT
jgi:hypothetical protein